MLAKVRAWIANPVLFEWEQSREWCELASRRSLAQLDELARVLAFRAAPEGLLVLLAGIWAIGQIPGSGGPPWRAAAVFGVPLLLALLLPYLALRSGLVKTQRGEGLRIRLRRRTLEIVGARGVVRTLGWWQFEAFDFGVCDGFQVLKLRVRDTWPFRGRRPEKVVAFEVGGSSERLAAIRDVLRGRGLREEPLGEPTR